MILNISDNNAVAMARILHERQCRHVLLASYATAISPLLDFFSGNALPVQTLTVFCENAPRRENFPHARNWHDKGRRWSLAYMRRFFLADNPVDFSGHQPVYAEDVSRLTTFHRTFAAGPLNRLRAKFRAGSWMERGICAAGLTLQIVLPFLRPRTGTITWQDKNIAITVHYDGGPEKDHYGENPLVGDKVAAFRRAIPRTQAILIAAGPREIYIRSALQAEADRTATDFVLFCAGLYRQRNVALAEQHTQGHFQPGSNITAGGETLYAQHCLSIGAGARDMWVYESGAPQNRVKDSEYETQRIA